MNNYYKAFSVLVFGQAHPEFSVSAQKCLPTIYCNYTWRTVFATTRSFKGLNTHTHTHTHRHTDTDTHTHTHTQVCRETFKRVYSPNNFHFAEKCVNKCYVYGLLLLFHVSLRSTNVCLLQKPQSLLRRQ